MAVMVQVDGKDCNNSYSGEFCADSWDEATQIYLNCCLKFFPSTYTITVISWPLLLISQFFYTSYVKQGRTLLYSQAVFEQIIIIIM